MRVLTVTPNPSIDLLFAVGTLVWDDANRVQMPRRRAGGQGINVTRAVRALGGNSVVATLLGGATGAELEQLLRDEDIEVRAVHTAGDTRVFVAVREHDSGRSLLLNPRGPQCDGSDEDALLNVVKSRVTGMDWVVTSGSVPPGFTPAFHARVRDTARAAGSRVVVDSDGAGLAQAAEGCALLVPNIHEAERLLRKHIAGVREAAEAARGLLRFGAAHAAITLGEDGAVLAIAGNAAVLHAAAPRTPAGSAVGAGDAFLAGLLMALDRVEPGEALRRAVAAGSSVLYAGGSDLIDAPRIDAIAAAINVEEAG